MPLALLYHEDILLGVVDVLDEWDTCLPWSQHEGKPRNIIKQFEVRAVSGLHWHRPEDGHDEGCKPAGTKETYPQFDRGFNPWRITPFAGDD